MKNTIRMHYWNDQLEKNKLVVLSRLLEYEDELERLQQNAAKPDYPEKIRKLCDKADALYPVFLKDFDRAILGITEPRTLGHEHTSMQVVYSRSLIFKLLYSRGMTHLQALDFYDSEILPLAQHLTSITIMDDLLSP